MIKKLSSLILLLLICISNAFADEVHADLSTYKSKGSNIDISDWENKQILTWTGGTDNMIRLSGLTLGDLSDYSQLVVKSSDAGTEGSQSAATGFRILIYHGSENVQIEVNSLGTETYNLSELGIDITNVTDICVAGIRYNPGGSVKIDDVYLVEAETEEVHMTPKAEGGHGNITIDDWTSNQILTWTAGSYNHINLQGLPTGDLSEYTQLVVVSSSAEGQGSKPNATQFRIIMYFNGKPQETLYVDELGEFVYDLSKLGDKIFYVTQICVSGASSPEGSVKIDDVYLVKANKIYAEQAGSTPLSSSMYKTWDEQGNATGTPTSDNKINSGEELVGGNVLYGVGSVWADCYADLSEYDYMIVRGASGSPLRFMINRVSNDGAYIEYLPTVGTDGVLRINLQEVLDNSTASPEVSREYFHLNCIKIPYVGATANITSIELYKNDTPVAYTLKGAGNFDASVANALNDPTAEYYDAEYLKSAITLNPANPNALIYARENVVTRENNANIVVNNECSNLMLVDKKPFSLQKTLTLGNPARFTMVMSSAGMATIVLPFDATLPDGISAYNIVATEDDLALTEECDAIQKNQPVLIVGSEGEYVFFGYQSDTELPATTGDLTSGLLIGTYKDIEVPDGSYLLQNHSGAVGFYYVDNSINVVGLKPFHAYLSEPSLNAKSVRIFIDDSATSVNTVKTVSDAPKSAFNLAGQEVKPNAKGFVIINGIKVYNK
ncbi:MAG: hypothetical protein K5874_01155 [Bacteroidaceae bacterium]|nr:hypothetical protein [Bacteroidaceae bacterium]